MIRSIILAASCHNFVCILTDSSSCRVSTELQFKALGGNFLRLEYQSLYRQEFFACLSKDMFVVVCPVESYQQCHRVE